MYRSRYILITAETSLGEYTGHPNIHVIVLFMKSNNQTDHNFVLSFKKLLTKTVPVRYLCPVYSQFTHRFIYA